MTIQQPSLASFFGDYRAEWPQDLFGSLFVRPAYFGKLIAKRPSFLIGGRGTGKTTSLKSLRFDAAASQLPPPTTARSLPYLGIYLRMNKNRVRAFRGQGLSEQVLSQAFAHYFNLLACEELCRLTTWLQTQGGATTTSLDLSRVALSLGLPELSATAAELGPLLGSRIAQLELFVNNPQTAAQPVYSMSEAPVTYFAAALQNAGYLQGRTIFCCLDEYENLTEAQQSIINTYIKHSEPPLAYKIGVRRNGIWTRSTIDGRDQIATPDDYAEIDIATENFESFARDVVALRLRRARENGISLPDRTEDFLPEMDFATEAILLGASRIAEPVRAELLRSGSPKIVAWVNAQPDEELYFVGYWHAGHPEEGDLAAVALSAIEEPEAWRTRFGNYSHASLFWLSRGRKGARIRKYYCGINTFLGLSSGNIRYFIELIDESIAESLSVSEGGSGNPISISGEAQTAAATSVGRKRLAQIEGLSKRGPDLKRLVLAIGKVFFEFARDPHKSPETNAFVLAGTPIARAEVDEILRDGVANQAFEATPRTKPTSAAEMRDEEYRIHPIYAPFFAFSYRRKRRATFDAADLLLVRSKPTKAIRNLLGESAAASRDTEPPQLQMFSAFYEGGDDE